MPIQYTQRDPNAFYKGAEFEQQNRLTDLAMQNQAQDRQIAADDRAAKQRRQAEIDALDSEERDRQKIARNMPFAQYLAQSTNPHAELAAALSDPSIGKMLRADGILDDEDLNDPELPQSLQAFIGLAGPQKPVDPGPMEQIVGPDGNPVFAPRSQVAGKRPYIKPDATQAADKPQLVDVQMPDGTTQKQWLRPGQTAGPAVGAPSSNEPKMRDVANLRKEFEGTPEVKNYRSVLPLYDRAKKAPNTRAGDLSIIYALGKMFDPTSVVREGELILAQNTAPWLKKMASAANSQMTGQGAMDAKTRADIMAALDGQVEAFRQPYEQQRQRFGSYATDYGIDPFKVTGDDAKEAFGAGPSSGGPVRVNTPQEAMALPGGTQFVTPDGRVKVRP